LCEGTSSYNLYEREKGKFKQSENVLLRELFKGTVALFPVKKKLHENFEAKRACAKNLLELSFEMNANQS
jgi:hypothetical protein